MSDTLVPQITWQDDQSLAEKLKELKPSLSAGEQALRAMIALTTQGGDDVQGFNMYNGPYTTEIAQVFAQPLPGIYSMDDYLESIGVETVPDIGRIDDSTSTPELV